MAWHSEDYTTALEKYDSNPEKGLESSQIEQNREKFGKNELREEKSKSPIILLLEQFNNPVIYILIAAAVVNSIVADLKDAIVIAAVVILNTVIGFIQERRAERALKSLKSMAAPDARVIRNGSKESVSTDELVCGDILLLESGVRVPADARLIETHNFVVDESMLTGESFAVTKKADLEIDEKAPLGDRKTMVYSGTIVQKGRAKAVVTSVGTETEFGKISEKVAESEESISPLQENINRFSKYLSAAIMGVVVLIFIVGFLQGKDWVTMMMTAVGLAVSAIPEGLPVAVTITLAIGINQMAKHKAIIKKLSAVETLGSTNVICTDKTGTLTKNQMTVEQFYIGKKRLEVSGTGYSKDGEVKGKDGKAIKYDSNKSSEMAALIGLLCTESSIKDDGDKWKISGDPTEVALMIAARKLGFECTDCKVDVDIPFESELQMMAVRAEYRGNTYILAKGAPEKIIERSSAIIDSEGNELDINKDEINKVLDEFSEMGLRVLAMGYTETNKDQIELDDASNLKLVGFAGIFDSVREEAVEAVKDCTKAGIRVVMITGDHIKTARAVASNIGIAGDKEKPEAINGVELEEIGESGLADMVDNLDVYARVAPEHKYSIVQQLQKKNKIVAMTGDGVNDAPALKKADIGIAMGSGTDVAKEAAHMILMDDNFATIVKAVRRGRVILHNLQHILIYILATSFGGLLTIATSVFLGMPLPLLAVQLLWVNLVTDGTSTFPLAFEKEHGNVMDFPPRRKDAPLVSRRMVIRMGIAGFIMMIGTLTIFNMYLPDMQNYTEYQLDYAQTMAFCVLAFFQIWNVQNSRSVDRSLFFNIKTKEGKIMERIRFTQNLPLLGVMLLAAGLQVAAVEIPVMNTLLNTVQLKANDWWIVIGTTFSIVVIIEIVKIIGSGLIFKKQY
ncbi:MAG: cation-translocating P-type ATPase [Candidatus Kapaibacterium sp.]